MYRSNPMRILIIDDNKEIHKDFYKVLLNQDEINPVIDIDEIALFADQKEQDKEEQYVIESAFQGQEALALVEKSIATRQPYSLAFVDVRMPPGWDGIETIKQIWKVDPNIQIVIVSAYSEYTWEDIIKALGKTDSLLILKKPFEVMEIRQFALALTRKWALQQDLEFQIENLNLIIEERTMELKNALSMTDAALDASTEGIIAVSKDKKILKYNQRFLDLFNLTQKSMRTESADTIFSKIANQSENPIIFLNMIDKLQKEFEPETAVEWKLKSDIILEINQHAHTIKEEVIGVVYSFRDITE